MTHDTCPSHAQLVAFHLGDLPEDQVDGIAAHLEDCPACEAEARALDGMEDRALAVLRGSRNTPLALPSTLTREGDLGQPSHADRIDDYQLLGEIGRGGMGVVYRAWHAPLRRVVALKMMLAGRFADPKHRARFRTEAEAVARLQHPNIVQVHDYGEYEGQPYFTLEYVDNGTLAERLAGKPVGATQAATWLETIARAVAHAHAQGLIHRDLKPSNVLLAPDGTLKIADFGLAKLLQGASQETDSKMILGTPEYMAPEQAKAQQVSPRTDVYALGAILYVCLTGRPPFQGVTTLDTLAQVCDQPPLLPRQLQPGVPRDLETICLKCLAKEPSKRYGTVLELADDLHRFLEGRPIVARPVGVLERTARWARRRPALAGLLATLFLAALATLGESVSLWRQQQKTLEERNRAEAERDRANQNFSLARQAVEDYLDKVTDNPRLKQADFHPLRRQLLESAVPFYESLAQQQADDPQFALVQGRAYKRLAAVRDLLGDFTQALADYRQMEQIFAAQGERDPGAAECRRELALSKNGQGLMLYRLDRQEESVQAYRQALALQEDLVHEFPKEPKYRQELAQSYIGRANALMRLGRYAEAEQGDSLALPLLEALHAEFPPEQMYRSLLANVHNSLGQVLNNTQHLPEAEQHYRQCILFKEELVRDFPAVPEYRQSLAGSHNNLAGTLRNRGRPTDAVSEYRQGLEQYERLTAAFPSVPAYRDQQIIMRFNLGAQFYELKRYAEAEDQGAKAIAEGELLVRDFPQVPAYRNHLGTAIMNLADLQATTGRLSAAAAGFQRSAAIFAELAAHSRVADFRANWTSARALGACALARQGDYRAAGERLAPIDEDQAPDGLSRYNVASAYARSSAAVALDAKLDPSERRRLTEDYAAKALTWLAASQALHFFNGKGNVDMLRADHAFESLKGRADFQKFVSQFTDEPAKALK